MNCTVLQRSERRNRAVPRESAEATATLALISAEEVLKVLQTTLYALDLEPKGLT